MTWTHTFSLPPPKTQNSPSSDNKMTAVFWDAKGVLVDFLPRADKINAARNCGTLNESSVSVRRKIARNMRDDGILRQCTHRRLGTPNSGSRSMCGRYCYIPYKVTTWHPQIFTSLGPLNGIYRNSSLYHCAENDLLKALEKNFFVKRLNTLLLGQVLQQWWRVCRKMYRHTCKQLYLCGNKYCRRAFAYLAF